MFIENAGAMINCLPRCMHQHEGSKQRIASLDYVGSDVI